jgi:hypothetical protein
VGKYVTDSAVYNTVEGRKRFYGRKVRERNRGREESLLRKIHTGSGSGSGIGSKTL